MRKYAGKLCTTVLALLLATAFSVGAFATEINTNGTTGQSSLSLDVTAATFSVTVPTSLTFSVAADGTVTCPTGAVITNNGGGPVKVTGVSLSGLNGWSIKAWADDSFKGTPIGTKELMLKMNGTAFATDGSYNGSVKDAVISGKDTLALSFDADFPEQSGTVDSSIATITFTVGWQTAD